MIKFYDVSIDETREATQEDWDLLFSRVTEKHKEIERLKAEIAHLNAKMGNGGHA